MAPGQHFGVRGQGRVLGSGCNSIRFWAGARHQRRCGGGTVQGRAELVTSLGAEPGTGLPASPPSGAALWEEQEQEGAGGQRLSEAGVHGSAGRALGRCRRSRPPTGLGGPGETPLWPLLPSPASRPPCSSSDLHSKSPAGARLASNLSENSQIGERVGLAACGKLAHPLSDCAGGTAGFQGTPPSLPHAML